MGRENERWPVKLEQAQKDIRAGIVKAQHLVGEAELVLKGEREILVEINLVVIDRPQAST
jgi:hypothetical protein